MKLLSVLSMEMSFSKSASSWRDEGKCVYGFNRQFWDFMVPLTMPRHVWTSGQYYVGPQDKRPQYVSASH